MTSDEETRLTQCLADLLAKDGMTSSRDYYPQVYSGAIYKISVDLWQNAPAGKRTGTITAWDHDKE